MRNKFDEDPTQSEQMNWQPIKDISVRGKVLTMGCAMLALFLASMDQTIVGISLPKVIADLGGFDRYTWITTAYMVSSTTIVPIVGRLGDLYGRKRFYILGIAIFLVGSILAGISQSMNQLIVFRAIQGFGGGIMMANTFIVIGDLFSPAERGKYVGLVASVFGLSSLIGPILGGFLTDNLSWRWIFYVNILIGVPIILLLIAFFPRSPTRGTNVKLDVKGILLLAAFVISLLGALSVGGVWYPWFSVQVITLVAFSMISLIILFKVETRAADPIIPIGLLRNRIVGLSYIVIFLTGFVMFGGIIFVPLYFQGVQGISVTSTGSFMIPMMLSMVIASTISGQALSRMGGHYRIQGLVGLIFMALGVYMISNMSEHTSYASSVVNIMLLGFGLGITFPAHNIAVQNAAPFRFMGVAISAGQFCRSIGGAFGLAVMGSIMTSRFASFFLSNVPSSVKGVVPVEKLNSLANNPQALVSYDAQRELQIMIVDEGSLGAGIFNETLQAMRLALSLSISEIFIISFVVLLVAVGVTIFIKEIPLDEGRRKIDEGVTTDE